MAEDKVVKQIRRAARPTSATSPSPIAPEASAVPTNDGVRLHNEEGLSPRSPEPIEQAPEEPIRLVDPGPLHRPLQHDQLLTQREILERQVALSAERRKGGVEGRLE